MLYAAILFFNARIKKVISLLVILIGLTGLSYCQHYSYIRYNDKDGLPSSTVYDITQDQDGFIWFATENGLSRFDGYRFKNYTTKDGLPDNAILKVHSDNKGRIFFSPFTHTPYYFFKDSIHKVRVGLHNRVDLASAALYFNKGTNIVIVAVTDSYILNGNDSLVSLNEINKNIPPGTLALYANDNLIITSRKDSFYYIRHNDVKGKKANYPMNQLSIFHEDGNRTILQPNIITSISNSGTLTTKLFYASENNNLYFFNNQTGKLLYKIKMEKFSKALIDNEGSLWITTLGNGVYRFPSFEFKHITFSEFEEIFSIGTYNNKIVAGTDFSKTFVLNSSESPDSFRINTYANFLSGSTNPVSQLSSRNRIYKLLSTPKSLYIGADAFLIKQSNNKRSIFKNIFPVKDIDSYNDELLVCTSTNVLLLRDADLSIKDTLLKQRSTSGVFYDDDYYIGTLGGLIKIESTSRSVQSMGSIHPSFNSRIASIQRGINNDLWIATSGAGLVHFKSGKVEKVYKTADGITSDICTSLYVDSTNVWLGTNKGLNRIFTNKPSPNVISFTTANGLNADYVNSVFIHNNMVYAGSPAGLTYFNKNIIENKSVCLLHITRVSESNRELKIDTVYTFPYDALNIRFDFTAISFKSAGDNKYFYMLKGLDQNWNTTTNTFINYATLPPGEYKLSIRAINKFGVESDTKTITIVITPPWWKTWWFIGAGMLFLSTVIFLVYRNNILRIKKRESAKRATETKFALLEQQALQAQMNPHFIFNCLNSIQSFILDLDVEGANKYLSVFASMIRQTLDNSTHPLLTLANEVKYLDTYLQLEKLRFKNKFNYRITLDEEINTQLTLIPGMLLQPYIENAIRHGIQHRKDDYGMISLEIKKELKGILCTVKDNGVGRQQSEILKSDQHIEYQSKGTMISEKRIAAINNQYQINISLQTEDNTDAEGNINGTIVKLYIPFIKKSDT